MSSQNRKKKWFAQLSEMMKPRTLSVLTLLLTPTLCLAWGYDGHRIVGEIASHYLSPCAEEAVKFLLGDQTLADASTWADEIKSDRKWDWAKPLHYANVKLRTQGFDLERDCPTKGCVVSAIERYADVLRDKKATRDQKIEALKFLAHFVGDIHQPLHVSHAADKGGNDIKVEFFDNRTNLYKVWDSGLIRHAKKPWREYATELMGNTKAEPGDRVLLSRRPLRPAEWANESYRLALSNAYNVRKDGRLGQAYFDRNIKVVNDRLRTAGIRLALVLNEVFQSTP